MMFRFSHGDPDPVQHLSLQMESFAFDQSEAGSPSKVDRGSEPATKGVRR